MCNRSPNLLTVRGMLRTRARRTICERVHGGNAASTLLSRGTIASKRTRAGVENYSREQHEPKEAKRGRRSKTRDPDVAANKKGRRTSSWLGFEAGLQWSIERDHLRVTEATIEAWRRRGIILRATELTERSQLELPRANNIPTSWVRERCFDDVLERRGPSHEFVLRSKSYRKLGRKGKLVVEQQLVHWVEFARDRRTSIGPSGSNGLGLFAATNLSPGTKVAGGM